MPGQRDRLHDYIGGVVRGLHGIAHALGGSADHVHIFAGLRSTHCLADGMGEINRGSSQWIHKELGMQGFAWHEGYGGFTVCASHLDAVRGYVLNLQEHHRTIGFQEEYMGMLGRGLVAYDEAYLWERGRAVMTLLLAHPPVRGSEGIGGPVVALVASLRHRLISSKPPA